MGRSDSPLLGRMIFVVGARRSGTNWIERIICAHPQVAGIPEETYLFSHGIAPLAERIQHSSPGLARTGSVFMGRDDFLDAVRDFCDRVFAAALAAHSDDGEPPERLVERTPWHAKHLELIGSVYPDAHVVHILRDGRDVARSIVSQDWGPDTIAEAAREWRETVEAARAAAPSVPNYHEVVYEQMLAETGAGAEALFADLGLDASPPVVQGALAEAGVRFNVDSHSPSVGAGKWRASFDDEALADFDREAGALLAELGYSAPGEDEARDDRRRRPRPVRVLSPREALRRGRIRRDADAARATIREIETAQEILDEMLGALHRGDRDAAMSSLAPDVSIRLRAPDVSFSGRGEDARARLADLLAGDSSLTGELVAGDVHLSYPTTVSISTYAAPGGGIAQRTLAITVQGGSVTELAWYAVGP